MSVLVDTSVWVEYFRGSSCAEEVDFLLDEGLLVTNDLILAELLPALMSRGEDELVSLLRQTATCPLRVDWEEIVSMQVACLKSGINRVGVPDLIIAQNAIRGGLRLYSVDKHFRLMSQVLALDLFE
jgi:predicted nucleic acid-binding protein